MKLKTKKLKSEDDKITKSAFGRALGLSPGRITQLISAGLPTSDDGRWIFLAAARSWYTSHVRGSAQKRGPKGCPSPKSNGSGPEGHASSAADRLLLAQAQRAESLAIISQLEARRRQGELIEVADIEPALGRMLTAAKNRLLLASHKCAPKVAVCADVHECAAIIDREIRAALDDLSRYSPKTHARKNRP